MSLKKNLKMFVNTLATLNNQNYSYYQGYHDIALHFLLLYMNDFHTGVSVFQRFSEFFLKENLMKPDQNFNKGYNFERVISILADIIKLISPETMTYIDEYCYGRPSFAISWILTLFTHNILDSSVQFRLFDYFITSHPVTIFYLVAVIVIEETLKLAKNNQYLV
jgi:TBC1 domain family member 20